MWFDWRVQDNIHAEAKVFQRPSFWGIRNSRISKLYIYEYDESSDEWNHTYTYDRGGESGHIDEGILDKILEEFPGTWEQGD